jgi:hypothetical protein
LEPENDDPYGPLRVERLLRENNGGRAADTRSDRHEWLASDLDTFLKEHKDALEMIVQLTTLAPRAT